MRTGYYQITTPPTQIPVRVHPSNEPDRPRLLLVQAGKGSTALLEGLEGLGIEILQASSCRQARHVLATGPDVHVVLTDATLPDGDWGAIVSAVVANSANTEIVVLAASVHKRLRSDVLGRGGYDL